MRLLPRLWFLLPLIAVPHANASILLSLCAPSDPECAVTAGVRAEGSDFRWTYSASLAADQRLEPESDRVNQIIIGDFFGFVDGSNTQPDGWTFSVVNSGPPPFPLPLTGSDNPQIPNLVWTYTGSATIIGPAFLGLFTAVSNSQNPNLGFFGGTAIKHVPGSIADGTVAVNGGQVAAPTLFTPEPLSFLLLGSGLLAVGCFRRRIRPL